MLQREVWKWGIKWERIPFLRLDFEGFLLVNDFVGRERKLAS